MFDDNSIVPGKYPGTLLFSEKNCTPAGVHIQEKNMRDNQGKYSGCRIFSETEFEETDVLMQMMLAARQQIVLRRALCRHGADSDKKGWQDEERWMFS